MRSQPLRDLQKMGEAVLLVLAELLGGLEVGQLGTPAIKPLPDRGIGELFPLGAPLPSADSRKVIDNVV